LTLAEDTLIKSYISCKDMLNSFPLRRNIQVNGKRVLSEILQEIDRCVNGIEMKQVLGLTG
jgi:hypothetical protein